MLEDKRGKSNHIHILGMFLISQRQYVTFKQDKLRLRRSGGGRTRRCVCCEQRATGIQVVIHLFLLLLL